MAEVKRKVQAGAVSNNPRGGGYGVVTGRTNANAIIKGLQQFEPALGGLLEQRADRMAQTQAEKDFKDGKKAPPGYAKYLKYQEVHGKLQGAEKASALHTNLTTWLKKNPDATPEEYEQTKAGLLQAGSEGLQGYALDTFLPNAIGSIQKSDIKFQDRQVEILRHETSAKMSSLTTGTAQRFIDDNVQGSELNEALHKHLQETQKAGKGGPLNRVEISTAHFNAMRALAIRLGRPELLDYTMVKDKDGIALVDTELNQSIVSARQQAEASALRIKRANEEVAQKKLEVEKGSIEEALSQFDATDTDAGLRIREQIESLDERHPAITGAEKRVLLNQLETLETNRGWGRSSDPLVYGTGVELAAQGRLSDAWLNAHKNDISRTDAQALLKTNAATRYGGEKSATIKLEKEPLRLMEKRVTGGDQTIDIGKWNQARWARTIYTRLKHEYIKKNKDYSTEAAFKLTDLAVSRIKELEDAGVDFSESPRIDPGDVSLMELDQRTMPAKTDAQRTKEEEDAAKELIEEAKKRKAEEEAAKKAVKKDEEVSNEITF
jgi:hypothetical protein